MTNNADDLLNALDGQQTWLLLQSERGDTDALSQLTETMTAEQTWQLLQRQRGNA